MIQFGLRSLFAASSARYYRILLTSSRKRRCFLSGLASIKSDMNWPICKWKKFERGYIRKWGDSEQWALCHETKLYLYNGPILYYTSIHSTHVVDTLFNDKWTWINGQMSCRSFPFSLLFPLCVRVCVRVQNWSDSLAEVEQHVEMSGMGSKAHSKHIKTKKKKTKRK